jgi:hypothetical protein
LNGIPIQFIDPKHVPNESVPLALSAELRTEDNRPGIGWLDQSTRGGSKRMLVACVPNNVRRSAFEAQSHSWLEVRTVKPAGKSAMSVRDYWNGVGKKEANRNWVQFT